MKRITADTDLVGITWGGQSWENYDGKPTGNETFEKLGLEGYIELNASSLVVINI